MRRVLAALGLALLAACTRTQAPVQFFADGMPERLSDWHVLYVDDGRLRLNARVEPYTLDTPLFTDYAHKLRTVWMPEGQAARYQPVDTLDFPVGTIISKTFYYPVPEGGRGGDMIAGGAGTDTVSYATSAEGITVNLSTGVGAAGDAAGDALLDVENVIGSAHNDVIRVGHTIEGFDAADYLAKNADLAVHVQIHNLDPQSWGYQHWREHGRFEGREGGWAGDGEVPRYLQVNLEALAFRLDREPNRREIPVICDEQLVVEYYAAR